MNQIQISFDEGREVYLPGEKLSGEVEWSMDSNPENAEVHLLWQTEGRGTPDIKLIETFSISAPAQFDRKPFSFRLPEAPYSFSGQLISLIWQVEVVVDPGVYTERKSFVLSPTANKITLGTVKDESTSKSISKFKNRFSSVSLRDE